MKYLIALNLSLIAILVVLMIHTSQPIVYERPGADSSEPVAYKLLTTNYSELDSCHYSTKCGCLTASGTIASETTIACPRSWPLGTKVLIEGKKYVCEDRYNKNLSDRIDVWAGYGVEGYEKAKSFGVKNLIVIR